jgi:hypothetical protein
MGQESTCAHDFWKYAAELNMRSVLGTSISIPQFYLRIDSTVRF